MEKFLWKGLYTTLGNCFLLLLLLFQQWQTPPLGWRISRSGSTNELVYVNDFNDEEVCIFSRQFS